ncbi:MAG: RNA polymerase sigma factor [Eubacteriales bacterium]
MDNLIERLRNRDEAAFEEFVSQFERSIYNLALRQTGHPQDAQDITQEVFLRIYRGIANFRADAKLSTWVYQITLNACVDLTRRRVRHPELPLVVQNEDGDEAMLDTPDETYAPEPLYERTALREQIADGLQRLSDEYRKILILRDVNGLSYDEIGQVLALPEGTVKSRLFRARDRLAAILRDDGNKNPTVTSNQAKGR